MKPFFLAAAAVAALVTLRGAALLTPVTEGAPLETTGKSPRLGGNTLAISNSGQSTPAFLSA